MVLPAKSLAIYHSMTLMMEGVHEYFHHLQKAQTWLQANYDKINQLFLYSTSLSASRSERTSRALRERVPAIVRDATPAESLTVRVLLAPAGRRRRGAGAGGAGARRAAPAGLRVPRRARAARKQDGHRGLADNHHSALARVAHRHQPAAASGWHITYSHTVTGFSAASHYTYGSNIRVPRVTDRTSWQNYFAPPRGGTLFAQCGLVRSIRSFWAQK